MFLHLHQTHHTVADFASIFNYLKKNFHENPPAPGLHLFPELFLSGYPLQDLCLQRPFIKNYLVFLEKLHLWACQQFKATQPLALLMGGLAYKLDKKGIPSNIRNVIYLLEPTLGLQELYAKRLLPNYDIFDEKKYFTPGEENKIWTWNDQKIALMICEDMWPSSSHKIHPTEELSKEVKKNKIHLDLIVNLSASPFNLKKEEQRVQKGMEISHLLKAPFAYVNRVGGEDEILFDGRSFVVHDHKILTQGKPFQNDLLSLELPSANNNYKNTYQETAEEKERELSNTWENLFNPSLQVIPGKTLPTLLPWGDPDCFKVQQALTFGIQEYAGKNNFKDFLVALSGGIDSALTLWIAYLSLRPGQTLEAIYMPSKFSAPLSYDLSYEFCQKLGIPLYTLPIKFLHSVCRKTYQESFAREFNDLADENIQSRLRGMLLYAHSNSTGRMVLNTSNKSELSVGYSTLYGDSVGAISVLGDLYKTEVYQLAMYLDRKYPQILPHQIISRPPSAELREGQEDSQSLPPYERLDAILEGLLSYRMDLEDIRKLGFSLDEVKKVFHLYRNSEYKRKQFCPILKIKAKSFGFGYRVPISKNTLFYTNESLTKI